MLAEPAGVDYTIQIADYDPVGRRLTNKLFGTTAVNIDASAKAAYIATKLAPGTYVFQDLVQQQHWAVCFSDDTRTFTVHAGEAVFLGDFRPRPHLGQLERRASEAGELRGGSGSVFHYFGDITPPQFTTPTADSADFLLAKRYEATDMPKLHGRLQPVAYQPATFETGSLPFGRRLCGGYIRKKSNPGS
jgi:hypothetical protein